MMVAASDLAARRSRRTVTNTGSSTISGSLGVSPGSAVVGFPPGSVINGPQNVANAAALQAHADRTIPYADAAGRTPATAVPCELSGRPSTPGGPGPLLLRSLFGPLPIAGHAVATSQARRSPSALSA